MGSYVGHLGVLEDGAGFRGDVLCCESKSEIYAALVSEVR